MHFCKPDQTPAPKKRLNQRGVTILEYAMIGGTFIGLSMVGLNLVGVNLNSLFLLMNTDMNHKMQNASTIQAQHASAKLGFQTTASSQVKTGPAPNIPAAIPSLPLTASGSTAGPITQTVGANGTTETYAQNITDQAKQSLASGAITQAEYNVIVNLANKGHDIATIQGLLESAAANSSGNSANFANSSLTFNGQSYTPAQLNAVLASNLTDFTTLRSQASTLTGVLYDQSLLTTVNSSGSAIINNTFATQQQNSSAASYVQYQGAGLTDATGSTSTNQQSATICTAGQHLDTSNHCVP